MSAWRQLLRPLALSLSAVLWAVAAIAAAVAVVLFRAWIPWGAVTLAHWWLVFSVLVVAFGCMPYLAFHPAQMSNWKPYRENARPWLIAVGELALGWWVICWSAVAILARLGVRWEW